VHRSLDGWRDVTERAVHERDTVECFQLKWDERYTKVFWERLVLSCIPRTLRCVLLTEMSTTVYTAVVLNLFGDLLFGQYFVHQVPLDRNCEHNI